MDFEIGQGDTDPPFVDTIREDDGTPVDLSTLVGPMVASTRPADGSRRATSTTGAVLGALRGAVQVQIPTKYSGVLLLQWLYTLAGSPNHVRSFPRNDYKRVEVTPRL